MNKAVFLDKDGTLIHDVPYNVNPSRITLQDGAAQSLKKLKDDGFLLILISNQSGVAHGYFKLEDLKPVEEKLQHDLGLEGVQLDDVYFCPHHPHGTVAPFAVPCSCRKPEPGMILRAAEKFNIDLRHSWMIGDILHDVEAGNKAGCRTILLDNGNETEWEKTAFRTPNDIASNMPEAASIILSKSKSYE